MKVTASCDIQASQDKVFNAFTDLHTLPDKVKAIRKIELLTPGDIGVGTRFKETRRMFGSEATEVMEITAFSPPSGLQEEARSSGMHYTSVWTFSEKQGVTTVTITFTGKAETMMARIMSLIFSLMAGSMKKAFLADMKDLKDSLEK